VRRKVYESWYPTKPPPPPDINKKATRRPRVAQPFICLEFQLCSQPTSCRCPSFVSFEASSLLEDVSVAMAKAPNGVFSCLYICARGTKLALFSKALEPHSLEVFQRWRARHGHGHRSSRQVPGCRAHVGVIGPGVATDSNTIDLSYSPHHARCTPPTAPHPKRPQSTHE
jgi:hypothetical protein